MISVGELVRRDLIHREVQGGIPSFHLGPEAILDLYESALDTAMYARALIESMTIGDGSLDKKTPEPEPPHFAAARLHADDECGYFCTHATHTKDPGE